MKTIMLGWSHLRRLEKGVMFMSIFVAIGLSAVGFARGSEALSSQTIGPLILMATVMQSTLLVGIMRMRSIALNHIFIEVLKKLRDANGEEVPEEITLLIAKFLGDKK